MTGRALFLCCIASICGLQGAAGAGDAGQWIVVTAPDFAEAMTPLVEHRRAEGFDVVVVETTDVLDGAQIAAGQAKPLRERLRELCRRSEAESYILLVGAPLADPVTAEKTVVPPLKGTVGRMQDRPSDNGYGCLGDDLMPTVAVGRFPARSVAEAEAMVRKTLELEQSPPYAPWQDRLVIIVGNPGGSGWLEKRVAQLVIEAAGQTRLSQLHPAWSVRAIIHSDSSPFNVPGDRLAEAAAGYLQEGQMFSFYLGHSSPYCLVSNGVGFLSRDDWTNLSIPRGRGVFFTCGCFACQFGGFSGDGYALATIRSAGGPTAVIGAYGESYAAMGQLAVDGMLSHLSTAPTPMRLGTFWLATKAGLAEGPINPVTFQLYDQVDGSHGKVPLEVQRQEHLEMWMLLGDPALRLPIQPLEIELHVEGDTVSPGGSIHIEGTLPDRLSGTTVHVTLERPIGSAPTPAKPATAADGPSETAGRDVVDELQRANDVTILARDIASRDTSFECELELPRDVPWPRLTIRARTSSQVTAAQGILVVPVLPERGLGTD